MKRLQKEPTEKEIQNLILEWLSYQPQCKAWTNQSVGIYDARKGTYRKPNGRFSNIGSADILGIYRGYFLAIEVKRPKGKLTEHQAQWLTQMVELGALAFVARSLADVQYVLQQADEAIRAQTKVELVTGIDLKKVRHVGKTC